MAKHATVIMIAMATFFGLSFTILGYIEHLGLRTQVHDLGYVEQSVWAITQGKWSMPISDPEFRSGLLTHTSIIFYVIAPLYALFPDSFTLFALCASAVAIGGVLLYRLARHVLQSSLLGLVFGVGLFLNPYVQETLLFDVKTEAFSIVLLIASILCMEKKKWLWYWISVGLLLTCKEDMPFLVAALSPLVAVRGSRKHGVLTLMAAVLYWVAITQGTVLLFGTGISKQTYFRFANFGSTPNDLIMTVIRKPWIILEVITVQQKYYYILYTLLQGGFLAAWSPVAALIAAPHFLQNVLDETGWQSNISGVYYSGIVMTGIYVACIYSLAKFRKASPSLGRIALSYFILQSVLFSLYRSPTPYGKHVLALDFGIWYDRNAFEEILALIPEDAAVASQNNIAAHLTQRNTILEYPNNIDKADYILFHVQNPHYREGGRITWNVNEVIGSGPEQYQTYVQETFLNPQFGLYAYKPTFYLFKRGHTAELNGEGWVQAQRDFTLKAFWPDGRNKYVCALPEAEKSGWCSMP